MGTVSSKANGSSLMTCCAEMTLFIFYVLNTVFALMLCHKERIFRLTVDRIKDELLTVNNLNKN